MSQLFISLYLDEDVEVELAAIIRAKGFDVLTARDAGQRSVKDPAQLDFAVAAGRAILTHNHVHFRKLADAYAARGLEHHGIIIAIRRPVPVMATRALAILNSLTADEMVNQLRYI